MVESCLKCFGYKPKKRVYQMEASPIPRGRRRPRKTISKMIKKGLEINVLSINMIYDITL
ncbi:hypothetical protein Lal_00026844 [Lupinus albus]|nr:hypothetical protein Lal_00026844 [Lupinus albus]